MFNFETFLAFQRRIRFKGLNLVKKTKEVMKSEVVKFFEDLYLVTGEEQIAELQMMDMSRLMKEVVFPKVLCLPRAGLRYPRIDGRFMEVMTKCGRDFLEADFKLGAILLECAMQRLTCNPNLPAINYQAMLPIGYQQYSARSINPNGINGCPDEPGLWGAEELRFVMEMLPVCLELDKKCPQGSAFYGYATQYAEHARTLLFQTLTKGVKNLIPYHSSIKDMPSCDEVWNSAADMLVKAKLVPEFIDYCVDKKWRCGMKFFSSSWASAQDLDLLLSKIDLDKEIFYLGFKRQCMKVCGLYEKKTREKVLEEIRLYEE